MRDNNSQLLVADEREELKRLSALTLTVRS